MARRLALARLDEEEQRAVADVIASGEAKRVRDAQRFRRKERAREQAASLPQGVYNVILADPPWQYDNSGVHGAAEARYPTMPLEEICALPEAIGLQVADDAALFLWATNPLLEDAFKVVREWGFEYKTNLAWVKTDLKKPGAGWYVRGRHELCLILLFLFVEKIGDVGAHHGPAHFHLERAVQRNGGGEGNAARPDGLPLLRICQPARAEHPLVTVGDLLPGHFQQGNFRRGLVDSVLRSSRRVVVPSTRPSARLSRLSTASQDSRVKSSWPTSSSQAALAVAASRPPAALAERRMMRPHIGSSERLAQN